MTTPLLRVDDLHRRFGGVAAVDGVSLQISPATVFGLIGPNGAGKTTLVNLITGHVKPDSGQVWLKESEITGRPVHAIARAGVVRTFQNLRLYRDLTPLENVICGMHARRPGQWLDGLVPRRSSGARREMHTQRATDLLRTAGLDPERIANRAAGTLPYGDQRRLEIARALGAEPSVLVLDEPGAGMNRVEKDRLRELVAGLVGDGLTVVLIEHDMRLVMDLCQDVAVLNFGRRIAGGSPAQVAADPGVIAAYLGTPADVARTRTKPVPRSAGAAAMPSTRGDPPAGAAAMPSAPGHPPAGAGVASGPAEGALLSATGLSVRYGAVEAVKNVTLDVAEGELVALVGSNGAGKSTILRALTGLVPASGSASFDGIDILRSRTPALIRAGLAHVPEGREILGRQTVEENLLLGDWCRGRLGGLGRLGRRPANGIADRVAACYDRFPILAERRRLAAGQLSGGEQQILAVARALIGQPRLLLLDEPSLGLAPQLSDQIFELIGAINAEGTTVLLVEQNARRSLELAHRGYVIENGEVALAGPAEALLADDRVQRAYLGA